jgi:iron(III) transport system substrate-binding protein
LSSRRSIVTGAVALLAAVLLVAACSSSGTDTTATNDTGGSTIAPAAVSPAWQKVIDQAKKEGSVTIYSSQGTDELNAMGKAFEDKYGVKVNVLRDIDSNLEAKVKAEHSSGKGVADVAAFADQSFVTTQGAAGWWTRPTGPDFDAPAYDKATNMDANGSFVTTAVVYAIGWNTQQVPDGINAYDDLLDPKFKGKIGLNDPATSPVVVDFYRYVEEQTSPTFLSDVGKLDPQVFPSVLQIAQNLTSGQLAVGIAVAPLVDEKADGAPVDYMVPKPAWGARFYASIVKGAPHPAAAQLLADFMVTSEGQVKLARKTASVLPNTPGAVTSVADVRKIDAAYLTDANVQKFVADFKSTVH